MNVVYLTWIILIAVVAVIGNLLTIVAFVKESKLREKPSDFLILALACVDFFTGLFVLPLLSPLFVTPGHWPLGENGCRVLVTSSVWIITASLFLLIFISLDRFLLVYLDYSRYLNMQTKRVIYLFIALSFGIAIVAATLEQSMWYYGKSIDERGANINYDQVCLSPPRRVAAFSSAFFVLFYFVPVMIVCGLSIAFLGLLRRRIKNKVGAVESSRVSSVQSSGGATEEGSQQHESSIRNRYIKPALTLIALVTAMAVCMLPYCSYVIVVEWFCSECQDITVLYSFLFLQYINCCLDPVLYAATQSKIRKFYRRRVQAICHI